MCVKWAYKNQTDNANRHYKNAKKINVKTEIQRECWKWLKMCLYLERNGEKEREKKLIRYKINLNNKPIKHNYEHINHRVFLTKEHKTQIFYTLDQEMSSNRVYVYFIRMHKQLTHQDIS